MQAVSKQHSSKERPYKALGPQDSAHESLTSASEGLDADDAELHTGLQALTPPAAQTVRQAQQHRHAGGRSRGSKNIAAPCDSDSSLDEQHPAYKGTSRKVEGSLHSTKRLEQAHRDELEQTKAAHQAELQRQVRLQELKIGLAKCSSRQVQKG